MTRPHRTTHEDGPTAALVAARPRALRGERGGATMEFALILPLLMTFVFGIITYGYMLSFRQAISQAAAEGLRAAVVAPPGITEDARDDLGRAAIDAALGYGVTCATAAMDCDVTFSDCGTVRCATVRVDYAYATNPLIPGLPFVPLPERLAHETSAVVS